MSNPFKPLLDKLPAPFRNKYFVVLAIYFAWLVFFDKHQILTQLELRQTLRELKLEKQFYQEKTAEAWEDHKDIEEEREKVAREKYQMRKSNEEVFIIVKED